MRILVISDGIAGLDAVEATAQARAGWRDAARDELDLAPVSAGGPGFLRTLDANLTGEWVIQPVRGPLRHETLAAIFVTGVGTQKTAYVEAAQACGLTLIADPALRDPRITTSLGMASLLRAALQTGASRIVVGLGGTAVNDAGAGMLAGLGAGSREVLDRGGLALADVRAQDLDLEGVRAEFAGVDLVVACATSAPLAGFTGASGGYSEKKGASRETAQELERAITRFATACQEADERERADAEGDFALGAGPKNLDVDELKTIPGAGSGGGLGFALGLLGGRLLPGSEVISAALGIRDRAARADLLFAITDGLDATTLGDGPVEIAVDAGQASALACVALARRVDAGNRELATAGISAAYELFDTVSGVENMGDGLGLRNRVRRIANSWSR